MTRITLVLAATSLVFAMTSAEAADTQDIPEKAANPNGMF